MQNNIGILEICEHTHYSVVNGLIKVYTLNKNNHVIIFVVEKTAIALKENGLPHNAHLVTFSDKTDLNSFFRNMESIEFSRFHICTISKYYTHFLRFKPKCKELLFHMHDVDEWFDIRVSKLLKLLIYTLRNPAIKLSSTKILYRFFIELNRRGARKKFLEKLYTYNYCFITISEGVKHFLSKFVPEEKIRVFPFAIYENMPDNSLLNNKIRICVPGVITNSRRDYDSLFKILLNHSDEFKNKIIVDLLGYVPKEELYLVDIINEIKNSGIDVIYHLEFVFGDKYDHSLSQADIVLGNLKVERNPSQVYGQTKESGTLYNMIRGAKPGILPQNYQISKEFFSSSILFNSYEQLGEVLVQLVNDPQRIQELKIEANKNSELYSPASLYPQLLSTKDEILV